MLMPPIAAAYRPLVQRATMDTRAWLSRSYTTIQLSGDLQAMRLHMNGADGGAGMFGSWYAIGGEELWSDRRTMISASALPKSRSGHHGMLVRFFVIKAGSIINVGYVGPHPEFGGVGGVVQAEIVKASRGGWWLASTKVVPLTKHDGFMTDRGSTMTN